MVIKMIMLWSLRTSLSGYEHGIFMKIEICIERYSLHVNTLARTIISPKIMFLVISTWNFDYHFPKNRVLNILGTLEFFLSKSLSNLINGIDPHVKYFFLVFSFIFII